MSAPMYSQYANEYAQAITNNVYNALLERPSMLAMLPELQGKSILDLGCGPGAYVEHFLSQGARVTASDVSPEMVQIVQKKFGDQVTAYVADLSHGLPDEQDSSYDLIVCPLTIHYIEDLSPLFNDARRVLNGGGSFFFSTHHPIVDFEVSPSGNYFSRELIIEEWDTIGHPVQVQFYRRSLTELFNAIANAGLYVAALSEGCPAEAMKDISPESYNHLLNNPNFLFVECKSFT
ncbi:class I SAM-dependent DNA methyltransferase [Endozoicomonas elysicola]|uniref:SAM-dependent methyltransferase n=1 Tax=Endozoicomonas elysicola TaxID=305900 RepID=A0A081KCL6_9GAMM|nr:class I SAM-dependent methyltransferase [Endozoicomonas elysicola]KEI71892.1 SAM-dependent methyltransferase [Endozoicomonas elysicola]